MHNLFLGYFHTPKTKRADVLRLMGSVLGLSREDVDKVRHSLTHRQSILIEQSTFDNTKPDRSVTVSEQCLQHWE